MGNVETVKKFSDYMDQLENRVMLKCAADGIATTKILVSTREPKLLKTEFGEFIGRMFFSSELVTFNYYGLMKVSSGFVNEVKEMSNKGLELKAIESPVVYFASLKMKNIADNAPDLVREFPEFKDYLVSIRKFPTK